MGSGKRAEEGSCVSLLAGRRIFARIWAVQRWFGGPRLNRDVKGEVMDPYNIYVGRKRNDCSGGIYRYQYVSEQNELAPTGRESVLSGFTHMAISAGKKKLLATGKNGEGKDVMVSYRIADGSGELTPVSETELKTAGDVCHLSISRDESAAAVTDFADKAVHFYALDPSGKVEGLIQRVAFEGSGTSYRQEGSHPHSANFTPDGRYCMVADLGANCVWVLKRLEGEPGFEVSGHWKAPEGSGPRHIAFDANSRYTYVITEISADVAVLEIQRDGNLKELQVVSALEKGSAGNYGKVNAIGLPEHYVAAGDIAVTNDGKYLAASVRGPREIAVFKVLRNGFLEPVFRIRSRGAIRSMHFNEGSDLLFALGEEFMGVGGMLEVYSLNPQAGAMLRPVRKVEIPDAFVCCLA